MRARLAGMHVSSPGRRSDRRKHKAVIVYTGLHPEGKDLLRVEVRPMKNSFAPVIAAISVVAVVGSVPGAGQQPGPAGAPVQMARPAPPKSPEIHPDRTVTWEAGTR
jgi:hypothetical protein